MHVSASAGESARYPSTVELDAYAQRTADRPLSIKIFPSNIRVPQHKQISRTVNGLDTRFGPCSHPYASGHQGLLAIVATPARVPKSSDGKRTKLSPIQMAAAPYAPPSHRHRQRPYGFGSHGVLQQMSRPSNVQSSPSFTGSCAESGFAVAQNGLVYSGAVLPTQSADVAGSGSDRWRHRGLPHVYGRSPEACYGSHPLDKVASSPFIAPAWSGVPATPDSGCYNPPEPPAGHAHLRPVPVLSSSLRSLESLISEIRPPCIKECMLGRGYDAGPQLLDHQLPVMR